MGDRTDLICRYGGEEIVILLDNASKADAEVKANQICEKVRTQDKNGIPKFTVSIGVATYPSDAQTGQDLLIAANKALAQAKESGRDQVVSYQQPGRIITAP